MPLIDHFRPPVSARRHWESFHATWAAEIMATLNQGGLPPDYYAETQIHYGTQIEVDVATLHENGHNGHTGGGVQTATDCLVQLMPAAYPDQIEVQVIYQLGGPQLVGAIELVSPRNKDRQLGRRGFAAKVAAYLQAGVGVLVVDIVTTRQANLHNELIGLLEQDAVYLLPDTLPLYCVGYRPLLSEQIEMRSIGLEVGQPLPTMVLALRNGPLITVPLEVTYTGARQRCLI